MQLQVVSIDDVYPDKNNPRQHFEDIEDLAASFDLNTERPGEPFTPPILVRDGGIYRIVDGERRYKALKLRRKTSFTANVCEDLDEVNTIMAMLATDNKQPLSDLEKSRGVQQSLLLGVDPAKIDKAVKGAKSKRIKSAMAKVHDAAEDMTLDRLLAIDEFSDDEQVVEQLTNCSEKAWEKIYERAKADRKNKKNLAEIKDALEAHGYTIVDESPDNFYYNGYVRKAKDVEELTYSPDEVVFKAGYNGSSYDILKLRKEEEQHNETIAEVKRLKDEIAESEERQQIWFGDHIADPDSMPTVSGIVVDVFIANNERVISRYLDDFQVDMECKPCKLVLAVGYSCAHSTGVFKAEEIQEGKFVRWGIASASDYITFLDAMIADGYELEPWEKTLFDRWRKALAASEVSDND